MSEVAAPLTREGLLHTLRDLAENAQDAEAAHIIADAALLAYIADEEIGEAFRAIPKWYA